MTAQNLIEILSSLPSISTSVSEGGDLLSPCFEDSGVDELISENGESELIFVIPPCYCNINEGEDIYTDGINVDILENVN